MESFVAMKQDPRSAADARASKILQETTYDGCRYHVGMLWTDSSLPNNYFLALVQLKSLERRLENRRRFVTIRTSHFRFKGFTNVAHTLCNRLLVTTESSSSKVPTVSKSIFHMVDYLESSPTINEATKKAQDLVEILSRGGFNLTKFVSNVPSLVNSVDPKS